MAAKSQNRGLFLRRMFITDNIIFFQLGSCPFSGTSVRTDSRCRSQLLRFAYCYVNIFFIIFFFGPRLRVGVTCWRGTGPATANLSPRPPLHGSPAGCWCHGLTGSYKVTPVCCEVRNSPPVTQLSRHNVRLSRPLDLPLCAFIESRRKLATVHCRSN